MTFASLAQLASTRTCPNRLASRRPRITRVSRLSSMRRMRRDFFETGGGGEILSGIGGAARAIDIDPSSLGERDNNGCSQVGSANVNDAPLPGPSEAAEIVPPWSVTICLQINNPRPKPPNFLVMSLLHCSKAVKSLSLESGSNPIPKKRLVRANQTLSVVFTCISNSCFDPRWSWISRANVDSSPRGSKLDRVLQ